MRIGVLGAGKVALAIAGHWIAAGHEVVFGVREPAGADAPAGARVAGLAEAAAHGEAILLAVPAGALQAALEQAGLERLAGKVLLDCSNGLSPVDHHQDLPEISGAEQIAAWAPAARVVKIFNTAGFETLAQPRIGGEAATMFYAADDEAAAAVAHDLAAACGFEPVRAAPLAAARDLEWLTRFWGKLAFGQKLGRRIAFKLLQET